MLINFFLKFEKILKTIFLKKLNYWAALCEQ